jgi:hypothetical protein
VNDLPSLLVETGLVQFGWFVRDGVIAPVQFHLEMLASYPDLLKIIVDDLSPKLPTAERFLCTPDALPLGVALALKTNVPLVYSRGGGDEAVHDLVGAYDIGHPAILVTNVVGIGAFTRLVATAQRVGLEVRSIMAVVDTGLAALLPVDALLTLPDLVDTLIERDMLPAGQGKAVKSWLAIQGSK